MVKSVLTRVLVSIPALNIYGAPIAANIAYPVMVIMNLYFIKKNFGYTLRYKTVFVRPLIAGLGQSVVSARLIDCRGRTCKCCRQYTAGCNFMYTALEIWPCCRRLTLMCPALELYSLFGHTAAISCTPRLKYSLVPGLNFRRTLLCTCTLRLKFARIRTHRTRIKISSALRPQSRFETADAKRCTALCGKR